MVNKKWFAARYHEDLSLDLIKDTIFFYSKLHLQAQHYIVCTLLELLSYSAAILSLKTKVTQLIFYLRFSRHLLTQHRFPTGILFT